ncbi:MAG: 3-deoxy-7-phosphoheptulonate synthase [Deltaproteobacteria bacterium]|nr:3-deoxy-7-phosphoheptulonate synthase [Deltaproteobacteria bacterium]
MTHQNSASADSLTEYRDSIDKLDRDFIALLARRMELVRNIGGVKRDDPQAPLRDEDREREIFEVWAQAAAQEGLSPYFVGRVLRELLNYSRRDQERHLDRPEVASAVSAVRVAYQGMPGSYSDLAITKLFASRDVERLDRVGFRGFTAVLDALEAGQVGYALLPIENTIAGSINEVYDLLAHRPVRVVGEEVWSVEHCLLGVEGAQIEGLESVRSHPVALQQCKKFLGGLVGARLETYHDTAGAARSVARAKDPAIGAIASEEAAQLWGLQVLRRDISDQRTNLTRFLLIGTEAEALDPRQPTKTSLVMVVRHQAGALYECLRIFDEHGINLTKLESRPLPEKPWAARFYVDVHGHAEQEPLASAIKALSRHTSRLKVLGSYARRTDVEGPLPLPSPSGRAETTSPSPSHEGANAVGASNEGASNESAAAEDATEKKVGLEATGAVCPPTKVEGKLTEPAFSGERRTVTVGNVEFGGDNFVLISGPCAVESRQQIVASAAMVRDAGAAMLRGGAFKPRSSPYSFQGLGFPGLEILAEAGHAYELPVVTEVLQPEDVMRVAEGADMLQVGARNMQNFSLLKEIGKSRAPVLLKRGLSATIKELLMAAEYIMAGGNHQIVLCERGIRTFETATRSTLDVSAVPVLKEKTHLPVIVDPSHAAGRRDLVVPLALAAAAVGADGLIVEIHPQPEEALCDKDQALTEELLGQLVQGLRPIVEAQGRRF